MTDGAGNKLNKFDYRISGKANTLQRRKHSILHPNAHAPVPETMEEKFLVQKILVQTDLKHYVPVKRAA
jgi:hypothetical protein